MEDYVDTMCGATEPRYKFMQETARCGATAFCDIYLSFILLQKSKSSVN